MCICKHCIEGNFIRSDEDKGRLILDGDGCDHKQTTEDSLLHTGDEDTDEVGMILEMVTQEKNIIDSIGEGSFVALYSDANSNELFYVCKVISINVADEDITDNYNHDMKEQSYLVCNYLEKISEDWKGKKILYKMIDGHVYVLSNQVFHPC